MRTALGLTARGPDALSISNKAQEEAPTLEPSHPPLIGCIDVELQFASASLDDCLVEW